MNVLRLSEPLTRQLQWFCEFMRALRDDEFSRDYEETFSSGTAGFLIGSGRRSDNRKNNDIKISNSRPVAAKL